MHTRACMQSGPESYFRQGCRWRSVNADTEGAGFCFALRRPSHDSGNHLTLLRKCPCLLQLVYPSLLIPVGPSGTGGFGFIPLLYGREYSTHFDSMQLPQRGNVPDQDGIDEGSAVILFRYPCTVKGVPDLLDLIRPERYVVQSFRRRGGCYLKDSGFIIHESRS